MLADSTGDQQTPAGGVWYLHFTYIHLHSPTIGGFFAPLLSVDLAGYMLVLRSYLININIRWGLRVFTLTLALSLIGEKIKEALPSANRYLLGIY